MTFRRSSRLVKVGCRIPFPLSTSIAGKETDSESVSEVLRLCSSEDQLLPDVQENLVFRNEEWAENV